VRSSCAAPLAGAFAHKLSVQVFMLHLPNCKVHCEGRLISWSGLFLFIFLKAAASGSRPHQSKGVMPQDHRQVRGLLGYGRAALCFVVLNDLKQVLQQFELQFLRVRSVCIALTGPVHFSQHSTCIFSCIYFTV
jgi:hypothetical protein